MRSFIILLFAAFVTFGVCGLLLAGKLPLGVANEWAWGRIDPPAYWAGVIACGCLYVLGVTALTKWFARTALRRCFGLTCLVVAGFAVQMSLQQLGYGLWKWLPILYSPSSSGYYTAARTEVRSASDFLQHYAEFQASKDPFHLGTHPPGLVLLHYGALRLCDANPTLTRWLLKLQPQAVCDGLRDTTAGAAIPQSDRASIWLVALLSQLASALAIVPIYLLARRGSGPAAAWSASAIWPLVPAVTIFMPKSDVLYPTFAVLCVLLLVTGRSRTGHWIAGAAAGIVLWLGLFLTFGLVAVIPLALLAAGLFEGIQSRQSIVAFATRLGGLALGVLAPTAVFWFVTEHNLLATWLACYQKHATFYDRMHRSYWPWVGFNLAEFAAGLGVPLAVTAVAGTIQMVGTVWKRVEVSNESDRAGEVEPSNSRAVVAVVVAWWTTLLALDFSGKNLGEVARLWIFMMPFAIPAAAVVLVRSGHIRWATLALLSLQLIQTVVFVASLQGFVDPQSVHVGNRVDAVIPRPTADHLPTSEPGHRVSSSRHAPAVPSARPSWPR